MQCRAGWLYRVFGPSRLHLKHEVCLFVSTFLFSVSTMQAIYRTSFGTAGDCIFLAILNSWLGRHLLVRWLATWDCSTSRSPTLRGLLSVFITSHILSGQTFDRPLDEAIMRQIGPQKRDNHGSGLGHMAILIPNSVRYAVQIFRVWILFPYQQKFTGRPRRQSTFSSFASGPEAARSPPGRVRRFLISTSTNCATIWNRYGPTLSFLIPTAVGLLCLWKSQKMIYKTPDPPALGISMQEAAQQNYHDTQWDGMRPHGAYRKRNIPPWPEVWFVISLFGVLGSLSCYFRIVPPIPDQIAGGSVLRDVRNEARGKARSTGGKQQQRDYDFMVAWPERNRSIISENRIRFYIEYILLRVTEYVFVVGFIPRLAFVCRATGHCSARAQLWELSSILYPAGVATPLRTDFSSAIQSFESHIVSTLWTAVGIVIVSCCLLSAQAIVLDKGYLAVLGYIGSEWTVVTDADTATLNPWDPKRKYKKGDLVGYGSDVYQATSNSPDGKPIDPRLRSVHKLLSGELGHNATSQVLLQVSKVQLGTTLIYIGLWVMFTLFGYSTHGLLSAVGANLVALYTLSNDGLSHHNELSSLRAEIMVSQQ